MRNHGPDIYELVEALKATTKKVLTVSEGYEHDMVVDVSVWTEDELSGIKEAILAQLKTN